jgi:hypothetical protein
METIALEWLGLENSKFLKQVVIVSNRNNNEITIGTIFYTRPFNENYTLNSHNEDENNNSNSIDKFIGGYPKQKDYPSDELDEVIIEAIRKQYPKAFVKNSLLIFKHELENLKFLKDKNEVECTMLFTPAFLDFMDLGKFVNKNYMANVITFKIYTYHEIEIIPNQFFYVNYPFDDKEIPKKLEALKFV